MLWTLAATANFSRFLTWDKRANTHPIHLPAPLLYLLAMQPGCGLMILWSMVVKLFENKDRYLRYVLKTSPYIFLILSTVGTLDQLTMMWTRVFYNLEPARSVFFLNTCPQLAGKSRISYCQVVSIALGIHWAIPWTANNIKNISTGLKSANQLPSPQESSKSSLFLGLN